MSFWFKKTQALPWLRSQPPPLPPPRPYGPSGRRPARPARPARAPPPPPTAAQSESVATEAEEHDLQIEEIEEFEIKASAQPRLPPAAAPPLPVAVAAAPPPPAPPPETCEYCGGRNGALLACTGCSRAWHSYCLRPPLSLPPRGAWLCVSCEQAKVRAVAADWE